MDLVIPIAKVNIGCLSNPTSKGIESDINTHNSITDTNIFIVSTSVEEKGTINSTLTWRALFSRQLCVKQGAKILRFSAKELTLGGKTGQLKFTWPPRSVEWSAEWKNKRRLLISSLCSVMLKWWIAEPKCSLLSTRRDEPSVPQKKWRPQIKGFAKKIQQAAV